MRCIKARIPERQMQVTYKVAMAAGQDAGNKSMVAAGRTTWNRKDYNVAAAVVTKLLQPWHAIDVAMISAGAES